MTEPTRSKSPDAHRGHVRCDCRPLRLPQPFLSAGIDRRWRRAAIRRCIADRTRARARSLHRHGGSGDCGADGPSAGGAARVVGRRFLPARCCGSAAQACGVQRASIAPVVLVRGDATRIPVADRSVDAVTSRSASATSRTPTRACAEMHRVLRAGRTAGDSRVRDSHDAHRARRLPVVLQPGPARHRPAGLEAQRGLRLPARVGRRVRVARRIRDNSETVRVSRRFMPAR